jgi:hypothetical protein
MYDLSYPSYPFVFAYKKAQNILVTRKTGAQATMNPLRHNVKQPQGGQTDHLAPFPQNIAPNAIRLALNVLLPWSIAANLRGRYRYPGIYAGTVTLLGGKAKPDTLKDWCSGRRNAPRWFVEVLRHQLLVRRAAIDAALQGLSAYEFGPGQGYGLREYWRKRHENEQAGRGAINSR